MATERKAAPGGFGAWALYLASALFLLARPATADIYKFTDDNGDVHFSNNPADKRWTLYQKEPAIPKPDPPAAAPGPPLPREVLYDEHIMRFCRSYTVEPAFAKAIMKVESDFNPSATSVDGALGLMQLMPETAERLGVKNPLDPQQNIQGGIKYLSSLRRMFGTLPLAAAAYNSGEKAVEKYGGIPPYNETQKYVQDVIRHYQAYRQAGFGGKEGDAPEPEPETKVYSVTRADGVVVYTNIPWNYGDLKVAERP